jgi:uncharacterized protein (TIGR02145 family)
MKTRFTTFYCLILSAFSTWCIYPQETITDYDGNVYHTVTIGEQVWLQENLKSLHYSDGTEIPGVVAYDNDDSLGAIYGLLYPWNAAMNNSVTPGVQGVCPCSCHVPTDQEWTILENYLGGSAIAGGKMKEAGTAHWQLPNTGATNSSGFTGLPAGEFDAYYNPNKFWLLHLAAVFWTSTQSNQSQAWERYLSHDNAACGRLAWYKVMKYSIRCIKDSPTGIENESNNNYGYELYQNYPNPFNPSTTLSFVIGHLSFVSLKVYDVLGNELATLVDQEKTAGNYEVEFSAKGGSASGGNTAGLPSGTYFYTLTAHNFSETRKMILLK